MWDLSGPEIEPMSPVLAGEFFTTEPPRKPLSYYFYFLWIITITELYGSSVFSFWGTFILFSIVAALWVPYCPKFPLSPHPFQHSISLNFFFFLVSYLLPCLLFWQVWGDISLFWFAFPWWLVMLGTLLCPCWSFICLLWKKCLFRSSHFLDCLLLFPWVL